MWGRGREGVSQNFSQTILINECHTRRLVEIVCCILIENNKLVGCSFEGTINKAVLVMSSLYASPFIEFSKKHGSKYLPPTIYLPCLGLTCNHVFEPLIFLYLTLNDTTLGFKIQNSCPISMFVPTCFCFFLSFNRLTFLFLVGALPFPCRPGFAPISI